MKRWLLPTLALAALVAVYFLYQGKTVDGGSINDTAIQSSSELITADTAANLQNNSDTVAGEVGIKGSHPFPALPKNRKNIPLDQDIFGPQSVEEQAWLDRNGFPTFDQVRAYSTASDAVLKQAVDTGDVVAKIFLDQKRLMAGDASAESELLKAASDGSLYAVSSLASAYGATKNSSRAYAMTRVSEMLGDNKVGLTRDFVVPTPLETADRMQAEAEALKIYSVLVQTRRKKYGVNVKIVDPRPVTIAK